MSQRLTVDIPSSSILRVLIVGAAAWFLWYARDIVMFLLVAIIIASALEPLAARLQTARIPRPLSVLAVYIAVVALLGGIGTI